MLITIIVSILMLIVTISIIRHFSAAPIQDKTCSNCRHYGKEEGTCAVSAYYESDKCDKWDWNGERHG